MLVLTLALAGASAADTRARLYGIVGTACFCGTILYRVDDPVQSRDRQPCSGRRTPGCRRLIIARPEAPAAQA
ncbi:hypothetical protein ACFPZL_07805, partial [Leucobacter soli]|uniref:hypothetical protein n=1 Tax=Leucobacter soli TaxID=2812850 RepID=UPI00361A4FD8